MTKKTKQNRAFTDSLSAYFKVLLILGILFVAGSKGWQWMNRFVAHEQDAAETTPVKQNRISPEGYVIVDHKFFKLAYSEEHEQALWVAYELKLEDLNKTRLPRLKEFSIDKAIYTGSANDYDYRGSGYTRGHLAPSADMSFDPEALQYSYRFSNISPQLARFNGGIWRELEEQTRDWARKFKRLYVVTGPIVSTSDKRIGKNKVTVPTHFYKVLLDAEQPEQKAIGFLIPHQVSYKHLNKYAVSVDSIERLCGFDFFDDILPDDLEEKLERSFDLNRWKFNNKRYKLRIEQWNNR